MPRPQKVMVDDDVGFEIKGTSKPQFNRKDILHQPDDIDLDIPNGELTLGEKIYNDQCGGCHQLGTPPHLTNFISDHDFSLGPAMRTCYLRKAGTRKNFQLYGSTIGTKHVYWTKPKLWEFLENPEKMFPDTNMSFDGIQDPIIMASIIEYLHYLRIHTIPTVKKQTKQYII